MVISICAELSGHEKINDSTTPTVISAEWPQFVDNVKDIPGKMYSKPPTRIEHTFMIDDDLSLSYCRLGFFYRLKRGVFL